MTRKSRLKKLELEKAQGAPQAVQVKITRHIIDRAQDGELHTVRKVEREFSVTTPEGWK